MRSAVNYCTVEIGNTLTVIDCKGRYWLKIVIFPQLGGPRRNTAIRFGVEN